LYVVGAKLPDVTYVVGLVDPPVGVVPVVGVVLPDAAELFLAA